MRTFTDHGSNFQNKMMTELMTMLGFKHEHSSLFYPQANGQVEVVNNTLKSILHRTVNISRTNWHIMLYPVLWAYCTKIKTVTRFSLFQLVHGIDVLLPIECEIPSLKLVVQLLPETSILEECLVHLKHLNENQRDVAMVNEH